MRAAFLQSFITVFPAELPDKTMVATIVLVTRYRRPAHVWIGATAAFAVHVTIAVAAGSAIGQLPDRLVKVAVGVLFTVGAVALFKAARTSPDTVADEAAVSSTPAAAIIGSFGLVALAEWGDLTQLATASLAARSAQPVATGLGAFLALTAVAVIAAFFGRQLIARVPIQRVNYVAAAVFAGLAIWTFTELAR